jgi:hypothetical protein
MGGAHQNGERADERHGNRDQEKGVGRHGAVRTISRAA